MYNCKKLFAGIGRKGEGNASKMKKSMYIKKRPAVNLYTPLHTLRDLRVTAS